VNTIASDGCVEPLQMAVIEYVPGQAV